MSAGKEHEEDRFRNKMADEEGKKGKSDSKIANH